EQTGSIIGEFRDLETNYSSPIQHGRISLLDAKQVSTEECHYIWVIATDDKQVHILDSNNWEFTLRESFVVRKRLAGVDLVRDNTQPNDSEFKMVISDRFGDVYD